MATNNSKSSHKAIYLLIVLFAIVIGIFGLYKIINHAARVTSYPVTSTTFNTSGTNSNKPNASNTSNQQLDQDVQSIQGSLNQLQQDQNTANQDAANQSQDNPQQ